MILISSKSDLFVKTHEGTVFVPAGSVVMVLETGNDVGVYDFVDSKKGVKVDCGNKSVPMMPGQQLVLTRVNQASFDSINPGDEVGYRDVDRHEMGAGITGYVSDFSIVSALTNFEPCRMLRRDNSAVSHDTLSKVLKTAAAVHIVTARKGAYKTRTLEK